MADGRNYQRKGDPFTLAVRRGEGPPTVIHWGHNGTGRDYYTRVPVHRCSRLGAELLTRTLKEHAQRLSTLKGEPVSAPGLAPFFSLDWQPLVARAGLALNVDPPADRHTVRVGIAVSETGAPGARGGRLWLVCPRCARRCGAVYASPWDAQGIKLPGRMVVGCRACLGLTDMSRQRHKCLDWASAVMGERAYTVTGAGVYRRRTWGAVERAHRVTMASYRRAFRGLGIPMPGEE